MEAPQPDKKPWYRHPIPWLLFAGPLIVVAASFITLKIALNNNSDVVSDDYYKDGKHINLQLDRDREAARRSKRQPEKQIGAFQAAFCLVYPPFAGGFFQAALSSPLATMSNRSRLYLPACRPPR